ncbi:MULTISPECIES: hypothetical protein [unclassified Acinetobacter]|uniref:hypothetical protein n=1 Tax=unclassified Acinetobacter TaxID=196816 RepID=UPI000A344D51|nr:hypothetical protein [Acinetobacter sp. ANC 4218]OTG73590.1 hypothetical protein B9T38_04080 [Acinetobacter sp. ANC 4218]
MSLESTTIYSKAAGTLLMQITYASTKTERMNLIREYLRASTPSPNNWTPCGMNEVFACFEYARKHANKGKKAIRMDQLEVWRVMTDFYISEKNKGNDSRSFPFEKIINGDRQ